MKKVLHAGLVCSLLTACSWAQTHVFKILPWNDHQAAVSLTFDDADTVQLDRVVPELNKRHLHGTFFLTIARLTRIDDWRKAQQEGHEIGNHSVTHEHAATLTKAGEETQVEDAKKFLDSNFRTSVGIFAYPYEESSPGLIFWVKRYDFAARGWQGRGEARYVKPDADPDWYNLPSQPVYTQYGPAVYQGWVDKALSMGAWTTIQMHGIDDPSTGWEPIPSTTFEFLLDYLQAKQREGLWVAPFGEVAAYFRAQRILERTAPRPVNGGQQFTWNVPSLFPQGVVLKVRVPEAKHAQLWQGGRRLHADRKGIYSVSFDARELLVEGGE